MVTVGNMFQITISYTETKVFVRLHLYILAEKRIQHYMVSNEVLRFLSEIDIGITTGGYKRDYENGLFYEFWVKVLSKGLKCSILL